LVLIRTLTTLKVMLRLRIGWRGSHRPRGPLNPQHSLQAGLDLVVGQAFVDQCVDGGYELSNRRRMQIRTRSAESVLGLSISHDRLPLSCCQP
jgi:hypothetical protein